MAITTPGGKSGSRSIETDRLQIGRTSVCRLLARKESLIQAALCSAAELTQW